MVYRTCAVAATALLAAGIATAAPPKVVTLPNSDAQCFAPWAANTKLFQYPAKKGPYRIALANGYIANTWRIQMIKTAKAYAAQPEVAAKLKENKIVGATFRIVPINSKARTRLPDQPVGDRRFRIDPCFF